MLKNTTEKTQPTTLENTTMLIEAYVDDFIAATNNNSQTHLQQMSHTILHGVHLLFPPPEITGHNDKDSIVYQKLVSGDRVWDVKKEILGWDFDGENYTIKLPVKKCVDICA